MNINSRLIKLLIFNFILILLLLSDIYGQAQQIKWLRVGSLHHWISSYGTEAEIARTGQATEQLDGMRWEALFPWQDTHVAQGFWIGTTNYQDRDLNTLVPYKVIGYGPGAQTIGMIFPVEFKMIGRFNSPNVIVDGDNATDNKLNDIVDEVDPNLPCDRLIISKFNTNIGITVTRKIYAFSQQYHQQYFIFDYTFKNTGIYNTKGDKDPKTLTGVYFFWANRYASGNEPFKNGWAPSNNISWGRNTVNHQIGTDPKAPDFEMRAQYSWAGPHSASGYGAPLLGMPYYRNGVGDGHLTTQQYFGTVIIHADKSAKDKSDDLYQPVTATHYSADNDPTGIEQYNQTKMAAQYEMMQRGHSKPTHAELVGDGYANIWGSDNGGYGQIKAFGPYTLEPGDSIHIVFAAAVAGLTRQKGYEIGANWLEATLDKSKLSQLRLPNGNVPTDPNQYLNAWVKTGEDSLKEVFRRAIKNYKNGLKIPLPPPPPKIFEIKSGGDRITLSWSNNAESWPNFKGYRIYRAIGKPDTFYTKIFETTVPNIVNTFDDVTAKRGFDYYYYIESFDDGSTNDIQPGVPLVSSKYYTITNKPAYLRRPAKDLLSEIRIVPNPFDIRARRLQFGDTPGSQDRIAFYGLPPECIIRIFTERGDLIKTIYHTDGSGDEIWNSLTSSEQMIVSGVYIAHFEVTKDVVDPNTGVVKLRKGDSTFRKFIVIR